MTLFKYTPSVIAALMGLCMGSIPTQALNEAQEPAQAQNEFPEFGPRQPIILPIPQDLQPGEQYISLELDGLDVSDFLTVSEGELIFTPVTSHTPGAHLVRIYVFGDDVQPRLTGEWQFYSAEPASAVESQIPPEEIAAANWLIDSNNDLSLSARLGQDGYGDMGESLNASGAGETTLTFTEGNVELSMRANYFLESQKIMAPTGHTFDMGEYTLSGSYTGKTIKIGSVLGDQSLPYKSMLASNFYGRGLSLALTSTADRYGARGFAIQASPVLGRTPFTGLGNRANRIDGFSATVVPLLTDKSRVEFRSIYVNGEGSTAGYGIEGDEFSTANKGYAVAGDASFFNNRMEFGGEYAQTDYDYDGKDIGEPSERDNSWNEHLKLVPVSHMTEDGRQVTMSLEGGREKVGRYFQTLANPYMRADRDTRWINSGYSNGIINASLGWSSESNNVDDLLFVVKDRMRTLQGALGFTPKITLSESGEMPWYGQPFVMLTASKTNLDRLFTPVEYLGFYTDSEIKSMGINVGTAIGGWSWALNHSVNEYDDNSENNIHTRSKLTGLSVAGPLMKSASFSLSGQTETAWDMVMDIHTRGWIMNASLNASIIPDRIDTVLAYSWSKLSGMGPTTKSSLLTGQINWTIAKPDRQWVGVILSIQGQAEFQDGQPDYLMIEKNKYQLFARLHFTLPIRKKL